MNILDVHEQAKDKLTTYRLEADVRRQLPKSIWRAELARVLRRLAERLEPKNSRRGPSDKIPEVTSNPLSRLRLKRGWLSWVSKL